MAQAKCSWRMLIAALGAATVASLILILLLLTGALASSPFMMELSFWSPETLEFLGEACLVALAASAGAGLLPAAIAGSLLHRASRDHEWAGRRFAWIGTGFALGLLVTLLAIALLEPSSLNVARTQLWLFFGASGVAGAGGALAFRRIMETLDRQTGWLGARATRG